MVESAALLVDEVLPHLPIRQWVLSFPFQLRFLFASRPEIMTRVLSIVYRAIETHLIQQAGCTRATASASMLVLADGGDAYVTAHAPPLQRKRARPERVKAPTTMRGWCATGVMVAPSEF